LSPNALDLISVAASFEAKSFSFYAAMELTQTTFSSIELLKRKNQFLANNKCVKVLMGPYTQVSQH